MFIEGRGGSKGRGGGGGGSGWVVREGVMLDVGDG